MNEQVTSPQPTTDKIPLREPDLVEVKALLTIVGHDFSHASTWSGKVVRLLNLIPPGRAYGKDAEPILATDCHRWLQAFVDRLASEGIALARMLAVLEGDMQRGWFYSIMLDMPEHKVPLGHIGDMARGSGPSHWRLITEVTEGDGAVECMHILGRFGMIRSTETKCGPPPKGA